MQEAQCREGRMRVPLPYTVTEKRRKYGQICPAPLCFLRGGRWINQKSENVEILSWSSLLSANAGSLLLQVLPLIEGGLKCRGQTVGSLGGEAMVSFISQRASILILDCVMPRIKSQWLWELAQEGGVWVMSITSFQIRCHPQASMLRKHMPHQL